MIEKPTAPSNSAESPPDMGEVYDNFAEAFRKSDELPSWKYVGMPAMQELLSPFFKNKEAKYLDLGSASGRVEATLLLPNGVPAENITGIEISSAQVEMAQRRIPGATFIEGDITDMKLPPEAFDVAFSHMVFEHLDDEQLLAACRHAFHTLKAGGTFAFVVTHPEKMTDLEGNLVTGYGPFLTTAPWGGELHNWRRSIEQTKAIVEEAGFEVTSIEEIEFPEPSEEQGDANNADFIEAYEKYKQYPAIRLAVKAKKPA